MEDAAPNLVVLVCRKCKLAYDGAQLAGQGAPRCVACKGILVPQSGTLTSSTRMMQEQPVIDGSVPDEIKNAINQNSEMVGKYLLLRKVGSGGGGDVYRAYDIQLERIVALKIISSSPGFDRERARNEMMIAAKLDHPGIPRIYESDFAMFGGKEVNYIAMEFVDGYSLGSVKVQFLDALRVCRDIALVLHYAHSKGVFHRDVKPANILITREGKVYLTDFGIAKSTLVSTESHHTRTGDIVGTPHFMSPEQARAKSSDIDYRTDIFSLGSTAYYLITGRTPFPGVNIVEVIRYVTKKDPIPIATLVPAVPKEVIAIVEKAMEKEKAMRYQSAKEMADDFDRYLRGEPVSAKPVGLIGHIARKIRRNAAAAATIFSAIVVLAGILFFALTQYQQRREEHTRSEQIISEKEQTSSQMVEAFLEQMRAAHEEALQERRMGASFQILSKIPKRTEELYAKLQKLGIRDARVHYSLGRLYRMIGNLQKARDEQAVALSLEYLPQAHYEMGVLKYLEYARVMEKANPGAKEPSEEKYVDNAEATSLKSDAVANLESCIRQSKTGGIERETASGILFYIAEDLKSAEQSFQEVLKKDSSNEDATNFLVGIYIGGGRANEALEILSTAIASDKGAVQLYSQRGKLRFDLAVGQTITKMEISDHLKAAIADFDRVIELSQGAGNPDYYFGLVDRGRSWGQLARHNALRGKDPDELCAKAIKDFEAAITANSSAIEAYINRGGLYLEYAWHRVTHNEDPAGEFRLGLEDLNSAVARFPDDYRGYHLRADLNKRHGLYMERMGSDADPDYDAAISDLSQAVVLTGKAVAMLNARAESYSVRAQYRNRKGSESIPDFECALKDYLETVKQHPDHYYHYIAAASTKLSIGIEKNRASADPTEILQSGSADLDRAEKLQPNDADIFHVRGILQRELAIFTGSKREYARSSELYKSAAASLTRATDLDAKLKAGFDILIRECESKAEEMTRLSKQEY